MHDVNPPDDAPFALQTTPAIGPGIFHQGSLCDPPRGRFRAGFLRYGPGERRKNTRFAQSNAVTQHQKNKNGFVRRSASKKESLSLKSFLQCTSSGAKQGFGVRMCESPLMRVAKKGAGCRA